MAITDKEQGVWGLDQVYNKINQGSIWEYTGASELWVWGYNNNGQLGLNSTVDYSSPVQLPGSWDKGAIGNSQTDHIQFLKTDGTLWTWGYNAVGQLGQGNTTTISSPTQVGSGTDWASTVAGSNSTFAIKTDGTLWSWGYNVKGQLGLNTGGIGTNVNSPSQIPGTTWSKVSSLGSMSSGAIKTDGTLWTWGNGQDYGSLGHDNTTNYSSPVQVGSDTTWSYIAGGAGGARAIKTDGTLWSWGSNTKGQLGQNNQTNYSSPKQVGSGTDWSKVSAGRYNTIAIKTDGTLWEWGDNEKGSLGQNNLTQYSSPVQVPGTSWEKCYISYPSYAIKTDGTLWVWGYNYRGSFGTNTDTDANTSSPVQIGSGTGWLETTGTSFIVYATKYL